MTQAFYLAGKTKSLSYKFEKAAEKQLVKDNTQHVLLSDPIFPYSYSHTRLKVIACTSHFAVWALACMTLRNGLISVNGRSSGKPSATLLR